MPTVHSVPRQHGRPKTFPYAAFLKAAASKSLPPYTYTVKEDGFRIIIRLVDGVTAYFSKAGHRIRVTQEPKNIMEAIVLYLHTKYPELSPENIKDHRGRCAEEIHLEFVAYQDGRVYLKGLFRKECLDKATGKLNENDFSYGVVVFDCVFNAAEDDYAYFKRLMLIGDSLSNLYTPKVGRAMVCEQVEGAEEMLEFLNSEEGLVFHGAMPYEECWKVKQPHAVMNVCVVAVANTIPDFLGYNLIFVAAPHKDGSQWSVIHVFDWTEIFQNYERAKKGKVYINPASVKMRGGRLVCTSSSESMQPLVNALFHAISGVAMFPAQSLTKFKATARMVDGGPVSVTCGENRSFSFLMNGLTKENGPLFLSEPLSLTLGCTGVWPNEKGGVHLQATSILALEGYGPDEYRSMYWHTDIETLEEIARSPDLTPDAIYQMVGMSTSPTLGLGAQIRRCMGAKFFFVPQ